MIEKIEKAVEAMRASGTILYPTDTIWGIGCDATDEEACQKVLDLKNRPENKSFIVLMDSFRMLEKFVPDFAEVIYELIEMSVEPLTIIYPKANNLANSVIAEDGSVAIRITQDPICLALIRKLRKPIVSTSANTSGNPFPIKYEQIEKPIRRKVSYILDERIHDVCENPSKIVKIDLKGNIQIIRK